MDAEPQRGGTGQVQQRAWWNKDLQRSVVSAVQVGGAGSIGLGCRQYRLAAAMQSRSTWQAESEERATNSSLLSPCCWLDLALVATKKTLPNPSWSRTYLHMIEQFGQQIQNGAVHFLVSNDVQCPHNKNNVENPKSPKWRSFCTTGQSETMLQCELRVVHHMNQSSSW